MRTQSVSVTGVGTSAWLPLDANNVGTNDGLFVSPGAGATVSVEVTPDNVLDPNVTPEVFAAPADLTGVAAKKAAQLPFAARAVRLNQTAGASTSTLKTVVRGIV